MDVRSLSYFFFSKNLTVILDEWEVILSWWSMGSLTFTFWKISKKYFEVTVWSEKTVSYNCLLSLNLYGFGQSCFPEENCIHYFFYFSAVFSSLLVWRYLQRAIFNLRFSLLIISNFDWFSVFSVTKNGNFDQDLSLFLYRTNTVFFF